MFVILFNELNCVHKVANDVELHKNEKVKSRLTIIDYVMLCW